MIGERLTGKAVDATALSDCFPAELRHVNYLVNWSVKHRTIYVETPKVGCTAIKKILQFSELDFDISRMPEDVHEKDHSPLRSPLFSETDFLRCLQSPDYFVFSFVRNPITRVLSAYLDKILGRPGIVTPIQKKMGINPFEHIPSFGEFIDIVYRQSLGEMNPHWAPQSFLLGIENIRYDYLGRFEYFDSAIDSLVLKRELKIPEGTFVSGRAHATNADDSVAEYYSPAILRKVHEIYHDDFVHFGYGWSI